MSRSVLRDGEFRLVPISKAQRNRWLPVRIDRWSAAKRDWESMLHVEFGADADSHISREAIGTALRAAADEIEPEDTP